MRNPIKSVRVGRSTIGRGVFAVNSFRRQEIIGEVVGKVITDPEYDSCYCVELAEDRVLEPGTPFRYLNHHCRPNCQIFGWESSDGEELVDDRLWLQALRRIEPGDELTIDYAWPAEFAVPCRCGSPVCRGWVVCEDELHLLQEPLVSYAAATLTGALQWEPDSKRCRAAHNRSHRRRRRS